MSHLMIEVLVGLQVLTLSSIRHVQPSCGVLFPYRRICPVPTQEYLPGAQVSSRRDHVNDSYRHCFLLFALYVCVSVHVHLYVHVCWCVVSVCMCVSMCVCGCECVCNLCMCVNCISFLFQNLHISL